ncbi:MAG: hypothetical protein EOM83_02400 [Clostridia bacterium]|nr:hypothetical protein [Clostridia bacterium]
MELGTWNLEFGISSWGVSCTCGMTFPPFNGFWNLEFGTWNLELGTWNLELGISSWGVLESNQ